MTVTALSDEDFSFNLSHYTQEELASNQHYFELEESKATILCVDYKMSGVGSHSCGPELLPCYQLKEKQIHFEWILSIC